MKSILPFLPLVVLAAFGNLATASPAKPVIELIEVLVQRSSGKTLSKGAVEALDAAYRLHGAQALKITKRSGPGLAEAAAKHGDLVYRSALQVPAAAPAIAARAGEIMPLVTRYGDDVLRLEARQPGAAVLACKSFSKEDLPRLLKLKPKLSSQVIAYASHASDATAARALLDAAERRGSSLFRTLDAAQIIAGGLSTGLVVAASGVPISIYKAPEAAAENAAKVATHLIDQLANLLHLPMLVVGIALGIFTLVLGYYGTQRLRSWIPRRKRK